MGDERRSDGSGAVVVIVVVLGIIMLADAPTPRP